MADSAGAWTRGGTSRAAATPRRHRRIAPRCVFPRWPCSRLPTIRPPQHRPSPARAAASTHAAQLRSPLRLKGSAVAGGRARHSAPTPRSGFSRAGQLSSSYPPNARRPHASAAFAGRPRVCFGAVFCRRRRYLTACGVGVGSNVRRRAESRLLCTPGWVGSSRVGERGFSFCVPIWNRLCSLTDCCLEQRRKPSV